MKTIGIQPLISFEANKLSAVGSSHNTPNVAPGCHLSALMPPLVGSDCSVVWTNGLKIKLCNLTLHVKEMSSSVVLI